MTAVKDYLRDNGINNVEAAVDFLINSGHLSGTVARHIEIYQYFKKIRPEYDTDHGAAKIVAVQFNVSEMTVYRINKSFTKHC